MGRFGTMMTMSVHRNPSNQGMPCGACAATKREVNAWCLSDTSTAVSRRHCYSCVDVACWCGLNCLVIVCVQRLSHALCAPAIVHFLCGKTVLTACCTVVCVQHVVDNREQYVCVRATYVSESAACPTTAFGYCRYLGSLIS